MRFLDPNQAHGKVSTPGMGFLNLNRHRSATPAFYTDASSIYRRLFFLKFQKILVGF
jgi:hypothetical protein